jgi:hypothetical protein
LSSNTIAIRKKSESNYTTIKYLIAIFMINMVVVINSWNKISLIKRTRIKFFLQANTKHIKTGQLTKMFKINSGNSQYLLSKRYKIFEFSSVWLKAQEVLSRWTTLGGT